MNGELSQLEVYLNQLKRQTIQFSKDKLKEPSYLLEIKSLLEEAPEQIKGELFEKYMTFLFEGVGYIAKHNGGKGDDGADILLYDSSEFNQIMTIVQTKNHRKPLTYKDTKAELRQFEEEGSSRYQCYQYLLISINGFVKEADKLKHYNMRMESWDYVEGLIQDFKEETLKKKKKVPRLVLNAHNQIAYEELSETLKKQKVVAVVRATGTGKSYLITELLFEYNNTKKLVMAPSHHILKDLKKKFKLGKKENVIYMTYQKLINMKEEELNALKVDLIIFDEFHRLGAAKWGEFTRQLKMLNSEAKMIGFSATPIRFLDGHRDMVEELFESRKIQELELAEAIIRRILPTPKYISSLYTLKDELHRYEEKINESLNEEEEKLNSIQKLAQISKDWENVYGVDKLLAKHLPQTTENMKFIVFCEDIDHLNEVNLEVQKWFNQALNKNGKGQYKHINPYRVHSKATGQEEELQRFEENRMKNTIDLLFSVNKFNEGLHVKGITGVILLRKTQSPTIYYQQIGRALAVGNQQPIIFDLVNNFDQLKTETHYHIGKKLKEAEQKEQAKREEDGLPIHLPKVEIIETLEETLKLFKDIEVQLKGSWDIRYQQLKEYYEKHHHSKVPQTYEADRAFAKWVQKQRQAYKQGVLPQKRIELLNELEFDWDPFETQWWENYRQLINYYERYQHSNVSKEDLENLALGRWVDTQRQAFKKGRLSQEQVNALNQLCFDWSPHESKWWEVYQELVNYYQVHQHSNVSKEEHASPVLVKWVERQRQAYKQGKLSPDRIKLLDELNIDWDPAQTQWSEMYHQLKKYYELCEKSNGSKERIEDKLLSRWAMLQRQMFKKGKLSPERIELLNKINFSWNPYEVQWWSMYGKLKEISNATVFEENEQDKILKQWQKAQRRAYKQGALSKERIALLNELNFEWDPTRKQWMDNYFQLKTYYEKFHHSDISNEEAEYKLLGCWVKTQRRAYQRGDLSQERVELLNELQFNWNFEDIQWRLIYDQLKEHYKNLSQQPNSSKEKFKDQVLKKWVEEQRRIYRKGKLSQERIVALNELNFDWDPKETQWWDIYNQLKACYEEHQHSNLQIVGEEREIIEKWMCIQRQEFKEGKLSHERIGLLNELKFDWSPWETQWWGMYEKLKEFYNQHQHSNVPTEGYEDVAFGRWVGKQRQEFKQGNLSQERIDLLNELSFSWNPFEEKWMEKYQQIKKYYEINHHLHIPTVTEENRTLGRWLQTQRYRNRKGNLTSKQIELLNELNFNWRS